MYRVQWSDWETDKGRVGARLRPTMRSQVTSGKEKQKRRCVMKSVVLRAGARANDSKWGWLVVTGGVN